jgi:hypothetical protein
VHLIEWSSARPGLRGNERWREDDFDAKSFNQFKRFDLEVAKNSVCTQKQYLLMLSFLLSFDQSFVIWSSPVRLKPWDPPCLGLSVSRFCEIVALSVCILSFAALHELPQIQIFSLIFKSKSQPFNPCKKHWFSRLLFTRWFCPVLINRSRSILPSSLQNMISWPKWAESCQKLSSIKVADSSKRRAIRYGVEILARAINLEMRVRIIIFRVMRRKKPVYWYNSLDRYFSGDGVTSHKFRSSRCCVWPLSAPGERSQTWDKA